LPHPVALPVVVYAVVFPRAFRCGAFFWSSLFRYLINEYVERQQAVNFPFSRGDYLLQYAFSFRLIEELYTILQLKEEKGRGMGTIPDAVH